MTFSIIPLHHEHNIIRQIRRLLGLDSSTEREVLASSTGGASPQEPEGTWWLSESFDWNSLINKGDMIEGGGDDKVNGAQSNGVEELESLLGKVSSYEGRLEGLLGMSVNAEGEWWMK